MSLIFFIGMPGSGKSYFAHQVSEEYGFEHVDTDEMIELFEQKSVNEIFEKEGEAYFRSKEKELLEGILEGEGHYVLISCGGGFPVYNDNLSAMKAYGCVVYVRANVDTLFDRLKDDDERPLLKGKSRLRENLEMLLEEREPIYLQADYIVDAENVTINDFGKIIELCTEQH
ncbi:MAG: shikimate kinase [Chitinophagales bacterium]|nr:shikimate kinase [Chitinophagaceae bacterium]MCB9064202.1 shikimate kinase [Chitinophagales bacterium]